VRYPKAGRKRSYRGTLVGWVAIFPANETATATYPTHRAGLTLETMNPPKHLGIGPTAVVIPTSKGIVCGAIGVAALGYALIAKGPYAGFFPLLAFFYSIPSLFIAIWYLVAAFLLARAQLRWRLLGACLDATASLAISGALVMEGIALKERDGPLPILLAIAAIWAGALLPVFVGALRRTGSGR